MLHDLIKAANRNLAPGADPEKEWLKYADEPSEENLILYDPEEGYEDDEEYEEYGEDNEDEDF